MSLARLRERLPFVVFLLLLVLGLMLLGFACACASDHHAQGVDRSGSAIATPPSFIELWSLTALGLVIVTALAYRRGLGRRPSLASLQRFLF